jgi:hypothetical protein
MFLTVFPNNLSRKTICKFFDDNGPPPGGLKIAICPLTKYSPNSRGIATTPIAAALRAATQTNWTEEPNTFILSPCFYMMHEEAKNWIIMLKLSCDVKFKAFQVDETKFNDAMHMASLLCYGVNFNNEGPINENEMSVRAMELLISLPIKDASRIRDSLLDFLDHMRYRSIPESITSYIGKKSRLSTKYAAVVLANVLNTVDT